MSVKNIHLIEIQRQIDALSAAQAAELLISPWVEKNILVKVTEESGPAMWVVNRSDVYDETLKKLLEHPLQDIAYRAKIKLSQRHSSLDLLDPPVLDVPVEEIPDREAEDVLGHPLCSFEAILHFSKSLSEDNRASSALSLTRRLLEHVPNWSGYESLRHFIKDRFTTVLLEDHSPYVRSYAARVPLVESADILNAFQKETNMAVVGRLLQNPATDIMVLREAIERSDLSPDAHAILAFDERLNTEQRRHLKNKVPEQSLARSIHDYFLSIPTT